MDTYKLLGNKYNFNKTMSLKSAADIQEHVDYAGQEIQKRNQTIMAYKLQNNEKIDDNKEWWEGFTDGTEQKTKP